MFNDAYKQLNLYIPDSLFYLMHLNFDPHIFSMMSQGKKSQVDNPFHLIILFIF